MTYKRLCFGEKLEGDGIMKCADIPDHLVVRVIRELSEVPNMFGSAPHWVMAWELRAALASALGTAELPSNLFRAKMRKLIDKKLVNGCVCGCRGDYEVRNDPIDTTARLVSPRKQSLTTATPVTAASQSGQDS